MRPIDISYRKDLKRKGFRDDQRVSALAMTQPRPDAVFSEREDFTSRERHTVLQIEEQSLFVKVVALAWGEAAAVKSLYSVDLGLFVCWGLLVQVQIQF